MVKIVQHPGAGKFCVRGPWISRTSFRLGKIVNLLDLQEKLSLDQREKLDSATGREKLVAAVRVTGCHL